MQVSFAFNPGMHFQHGYQRRQWQWNYSYGAGGAFAVRLSLLALINAHVPNISLAPLAIFIPCFNNYMNNELLLLFIWRESFWACTNLVDLVLSHLLGS